MTDTPYRHIDDKKLPTEDEQLLESPPPQRPETLFLKSDSWRVLRIMGEFVWGFDNLADVSDGVTIFGSARTGADDPYYTKAMETARLLAEAGICVITGGGPGIMEAANRGAHEAGGKTIGMNIRLPFEQSPNPYITPSLNFEFHYFFMRKLWFAYLAKALVVFPGGFGTLDEMFEILTLAQTHKLAKKITVVVYGSDYWKKVFNIDCLVDTGAISPKDIELFQYADTPEEAFDILRAGLTENYLIPEANAAAEQAFHEVLPVATFEDFLGPEMARMNK